MMITISESHLLRSLLFSSSADVRAEANCSTIDTVCEVACCRRANLCAVPRHCSQFRECTSWNSEADCRPKESVRCRTETSRRETQQTKLSQSRTGKAKIFVLFFTIDRFLKGRTATTVLRSCDSCNGICSICCDCDLSLG